MTPAPQVINDMVEAERRKKAAAKQDISKQYHYKGGVTIEEHEDEDEGTEGGMGTAELKVVEEAAAQAALSARRKGADARRRWVLGGNEVGGAKREWARDAVGQVSNISVTLLRRLLLFRLFTAFLGACLACASALIPACSRRTVTASIRITPLTLFSFCLPMFTQGAGKALPL